MADAGSVTFAAVRAALTDLPAGARVLVACSGGADSLALAAAAASVGQGGRLAVGAVIIDHDVQPGSAEVAENAAVQCKTLGLEPVRVLKVSVGRIGGMEAAARDARYAALEAVAMELGAATVLLGHTLNDDAEGVLLGLRRGSGTRSLAGMRERTGLWRRPFLTIQRAETEAACAVAGLKPWNDPTNAGRPDDPLRSRIRADVMPVLTHVLGPAIVESLARTARMLREDDDALTQMAVQALHSAVVSTGSEAGGVEPRGDGVYASPMALHVKHLETLPTAVRRRAIHEAMVQAGCPAGALTSKHVLAIDDLLVKWRGQGPIHLPGQIHGARQCGTLILQHRDLFTTKPQTKE